MPHWLGWSARGPDVLRVFSKQLLTRVIMPSAEMYERRERTCVTPARSILKRLSTQLPVEMAWMKPYLREQARARAREGSGRARGLSLRCRASERGSGRDAAPRT